MWKNTKSIDGPSKIKRLHYVIYAQICNRLKNRGRVLWALTFFIVIAPEECLVMMLRWLEPSEIGKFVQKVYQALP